MQVQSRLGEGIAFMREDVESWTAGSFLAVHNWWHFALHHLELGQVDEVLKLVDGPILNAPQEQILDLVDASSILWRLQLRNVDLGQRWTELARRYNTLGTRLLCLQRPARHHGLPWCGTARCGRADHRDPADGGVVADAELQSPVNAARQSAVAAACAASRS